jgi:Uma2 family endonuclease
MLMETFPTLEEKLLTGEELAQMPDADLTELIDGRIVDMSPTGNEHGAVEINFGTALKNYITTTRRGKVRVGEVGIYIRRNPDTVRAADALYISNERYTQKQSRSYLDVPPELVVEVLSPDDAWTEVMDKLADYFEAGVVVVWVANPKTKSVFAYRSLTEVVHFKENELLVEEAFLPGFAVPVADLFED